MILLATVSRWKRSRNTSRSKFNLGSMLQLIRRLRDRLISRCVSSRRRHCARPWTEFHPSVPATRKVLKSVVCLQPLPWHLRRRMVLLTLREEELTTRVRDPPGLLEKTEPLEAFHPTRWEEPRLKRPTRQPASWEDDHSSSEINQPRGEGASRFKIQLNY